MEQEIIDMLAFGGAFVILFICIYFLCIINKRKKIKKVNVAVVRFKEPVAEVINESDDILPVAKEVDEYLNTYHV